MLVCSYPTSISQAQSRFTMRANQFRMLQRTLQQCELVICVQKLKLSQNVVLQSIDVSNGIVCKQSSVASCLFANLESELSSSVCHLLLV